MKNLLEFCEVGKTYGKKTALREVSFSVQPGEIVGFLGPNGAGKTTALSIAVGLLHATSGTGSLLGHTVGDARGRRRLGYLPDSPVFFAQSSYAAMRFAGRLQGVPEKYLRQRIEQVLAKFPVQRAGSDVRRFSRGQQQRIALAQTLVGDPDLLILDEPTSALDPAAVLEVRELLLAARAAGKGIFFSSHQLAEVERICDRILFLQEGQIVRQGTLAEMTLQTDVLVLTVRGVPIDSPCWSEWQLQPHISLPGRELITVEVPAQQQRMWMEKIWAAGGEFFEMSPRRQSLESLFVAMRKDGIRPAPSSSEGPGEMLP